MWVGQNLREAVTAGRLQSAGSRHRGIKGDDCGKSIATPIKLSPSLQFHTRTSFIRRHDTHYRRAYISIYRPSGRRE